MQKTQVSLIPVLAGLVLLSIAPAGAQYDPRDLLPNFTAPIARYHAPYALQASAAYYPVKDFNATDDASKHMKLALQDYEGLKSKLVDFYGNPLDIYAKAQDYLRAWRYQFGSACRRGDRDCWLASSSPDRRKFEQLGPHFHVWARLRGQNDPVCSEVSIAFRGTAGTREDLRANIHPLIQSIGGEDHYNRLQRNMDALIQRITRLKCYQAFGTRIVSVGHSLGGGLAQLAALASPGEVRIDRVFAFNSSPWTGATIVDQDLRERNILKLEIDRVRQNKEFLTRARQLLQQDPQNSSPCVRVVRYEVIEPTSWSLRKMHNMAGLAAGIIEASYSAPPTASNPTGQLPFARPVPLAGCDSRYQGLENDNYDGPPPQPFQPAPQVATRSSTVRLSADQDRMAIRYASRDGFEFYQSAELSTVPVKLERPVRRARR